MDDLLLSIIVVTYNRSEHLENILYDICMYFKSLNREIIVSDDSDDEECIAKNIKLVENLIKNNINIKYIKNKYNRVGPSATRQNGLDNAHGKWVTFIDDDDELCNLIHSDIKEKLIKENNISLIATKCKEVDENGNILVSYSDSDIIKTLTHGKLFLKKFIDDNNISYDITAPAHEDIYFNFWIISASINSNYSYIAMLDDKYTFYKYKHHSDSLSKQPNFYNDYITDNPKWFLNKFDAPIMYASKNENNIIPIFNLIKNELIYSIFIYRMMNIWGQSTEENEKLYNWYFDKMRSAFCGKVNEKEIVDEIIKMLNLNGLMQNLNQVIELFTLIRSIFVERTSY